MTVTLPLAAIPAPEYRILHCDDFSTQAWAELTMADATTHGFLPPKRSRCALGPDHGQCELRYQLGEIAAGLSDYGQTAPPDILRHHIRVQVRDEVNSDWKTVFWGRVETYTDALHPGGDHQVGMRVYHVTDAFAWHAKRWKLARHGAYVDGNNFDDVPGHPGYNTSSADGSVLGNLESTGVTYTRAGQSVAAHTHPGRGKRWTDQAALEHALLCDRSATDPVWTLTGDLDQFQGGHVWPGGDDVSTYDLALAVCDRRTGKGVVWPGWTETDGDADLVPVLQCHSPLHEAYTYDQPSDGTEQTIAAHSDQIDVDLVGDQRLTRNRFNIHPDTHRRLEYLETRSERIQLAVTLSHADGLARYWDDADETAIATAVVDNIERLVEPRFQHVYQWHGIKTGWNYVLTTPDRIDYRLDDDGKIFAPTTSDATRDSSPLLLSLLPDVPLYEQVDYATVTAGEPALLGSASVAPSTRRRPLPLIKTVADAAAANERWLDAAREGLAGLRYNGPQSVEIVGSGDDQYLRRTFSDASNTDLAATYDYDQLQLTCGLELPNQLRMASGDPSAGTAHRQTIGVEGLHLWIAHPDCIHSLDQSLYDANGSPAQRISDTMPVDPSPATGSTGATPVIIRDDRDDLARIHHTMWAWHKYTHQAVSWSLRCCGDLDQYATGLEGTGRANFPQLGQMIDTLTAAGQEYDSHTPITKVTVDPEQGLTTWVTDWSDLDYRRLAQ